MANTDFTAPEHDFSRTDYVLRKHGEAHMRVDSACYWGQGAGEAIEIVIQPHATDAQLQDMSDRFGIPVDEMQAFRREVSHG